MEPTAEIVLASAFGGACLGSVITLFGNIWLSNCNYKRDYYRKIVDKRIEAYSELEKLVNKFKDIVILKNGKCIHKCFLEEYDGMNKVVLLMGTIDDYSIWFTKQAHDKFNEINLFFVKDIMTDHNINPNSSCNLTLQNIGNQYYETIQKFNKELQDIINNDFLDLNDVKKFLKNKSL